MALNQVNQCIQMTSMSNASTAGPVDNVNGVMIVNDLSFYDIWKTVQKALTSFDSP